MTAQELKGIHQRYFHPTREYDPLKNQFPKHAKKPSKGGRDVLIWNSTEFFAGKVVGKTFVGNIRRTFKLGK